MTTTTSASANSLVAAYHLPDVEVVCLEKEPRCGGNAQRSKWRGIWFTEGAAYTGERSPLADFMRSGLGIASRRLLFAAMSATSE